MIRRVIFLGLTALVGLWFYYISRFWELRLWDREGLFGIPLLHPRGGLLAQWLRGTDFAPYELLIWVVALFIGLTILQRIFDLLSPSQTPEETHNDK